MAKNRESRDTGIVKKTDLLNPLDITKFGTEDDPCFGKQYDLISSECKVCGDSAICQVVMSQNKLLVQGQHNVDEGSSSNLSKDKKATIKKFIKRRLSKNISTIKVISAVMANYSDDIDRKEAKQLVKELKHSINQ